MLLIAGIRRLMYNTQWYHIDKMPIQEVLKAMPTYVYACDTCGKQFEQFQSFKDEPLKICSCDQKSPLRRVFQPAGIVFKGSGWYITDSRKGSDSTATADTSSTGGNSDNSSKDNSSKETKSSDASPSTD
jgi:putative FmdB family regulatory protein